MAGTAQSRVRVVIPTTGQIAEIIYLAREDEAIGQSIVCIDGTTAQAGIGNNYASFVRRPSGTIERLFGHGTFRMDVSAPVDVGSSWQLATLLAHALEAQGRLMQSLDTPDAKEDLLIWATGAVRSVDLVIGEVGHVAEKVMHALPLFQRARQQSVTCLLLLPAGNLDDIPPSVRSELDALGVTIQTPADGYEAMVSIHATPPPQKAADIDGVLNEPHWKGNPYPGLRAFTREEAKLFCGRARAREEVLESLRRNAANGKAIILVHGRSGAGKSSLAIAGLANDIAEMAHEGGQWRVAIANAASAQDDPLSFLGSALASALTSREDEQERFLRHFADDCVAAVHQFTRKNRDERLSVFLIIDQIEQVLADEGSIARSAAFERVVERLAASRHVWILATMRSDRLDKLDLVPGLSKILNEGRTYRLAPPTLFELVEIITQPALAAGLQFDRSGLVDELAEQAIRSPDALPILQFVLSHMTERVGADKILSREVYERIGGFDGAIVGYAENVVEALQSQGITDAAIESALSELIRTNHTGEFAEAREVDLGIASASSDTRQRIMGHLTDARLLVPDARAGRIFVRLAHEALIRHWPRLKSIVEDAGEALLLRGRLDRVAEEWAQSKEDPSLLLRGEERIRSAEALIQSAPIAIRPVVKTYVALSRAAFLQDRADRERVQHERYAAAEEKALLAKRLLRRTMVGLIAAGTLALVALSAGLIALNEHGLARQSESLGLARLALDRAGTQPVSALVLALAAHAADPGTDAASQPVVKHAITTALRGPTTQAVLPLDEREHLMAFAPDGQNAAAASAHRVRVWNVHDGGLVAARELDTEVVDVVFSSKENILLLAETGSILSWNIPSDQLFERRLNIPSLQQRFDVENGNEMVGTNVVAVPQTLIDPNYPERILELVADSNPAPITQTLPQTAKPSKIALADQGRRVFIFIENRVEAWDIETGKLIGTSDGFSPLSQYGALISDDGRFLADGTGWVWNVDEQRSFALDLGMDNAAGRMAFEGSTLNVLHRHSIIETIGLTERIDLEEPRNREFVDIGAVWPFGNPEPKRFDLRADGQFLIRFSTGEISFGNVSDETTIRHHKITDLEDILTFGPSPDLAAQINGAVHLLDTTPAPAMQVMQDSWPLLERQYPLAVAASGALLLTTGPTDHELTLLDIGTGTSRLTLPVAASSLLDRPQISLDGTSVAFLHESDAPFLHESDAPLRLSVYSATENGWSLRQSEAVSPMTADATWLLSDGGRFILEFGYAGNSASDREAIIRATNAPQSIVARYALSADRSEYRVIGVSPDARHIAISGGFAGTRIVEVETGMSKNINAWFDRLHYSADGAFVFALRDNRLTAIDPDGWIALGSTQLPHYPTMGGQAGPVWPIMFAADTGQVLSTDASAPEITRQHRTYAWEPDFLRHSFLERACAALPYVYGEKRIAAPLTQGDLEGLSISAAAFCQADANEGPR